MGARRNLLRLLPALFLLNAMFAAVSSQSYRVRIKVLSAETHALNAEAQVPKDCDFQNYSAYCNESRNPSAESVMLVQDGDGKSFRIACTADSRWSKCSGLPLGETFEARKEKHGITILYRDAKGKDRKQFYQLVADVAAPQAAAAAHTQPHAAALPQNSGAKCSFKSTPSGAEITVDGRYVGNTPSEIGLSTGTHLVILSMPGFAQWKRELTVAADSAVNVTASMQSAADERR